MLGTFTEGYVTVGAPYVGGVLYVGGRALRVASEGGRVHAELGCNVSCHLLWQLDGIGQEGSQEPDRAKLDPEAEAIVVSAAAGDQASVGVVEVEVTCELFGRRLSSIAAVVAPLLLGEERCGHPSPTSGVVSRADPRRIRR